MQMDQCCSIIVLCNKSTVDKLGKHILSFGYTTMIVYCSSVYTWYCILLSSVLALSLVVNLLYSCSYIWVNSSQQGKHSLYFAYSLYELNIATAEVRVEQQMKHKAEQSAMFITRFSLRDVAAIFHTNKGVMFSVFYCILYMQLLACYIAIKYVVK